MKNEKDVQYINATKDIRYLGVIETSLYTLEGSRSGAIAASLYYSHKKLKPYYPKKLKDNLKGVNLLIEKFKSVSHFEIYETHEIGLMLFRDTVLPMAYLKEKFSDLNNINNNKIEIVSTNFQ